MWEMCEKLLNHRASITKTDTRQSKVYNILIQKLVSIKSLVKI